MRIFDYICLMVILMAVGFVYRRYVDKYETDDELQQYNLIKRYLLNDSSITRHKKPIIWIHIPYEYNSRNWASFGSRSSMDLNLPYQKHQRLHFFQTQVVYLRYLLEQHCNQVI